MSWREFLKPVHWLSLVTPAAVVAPPLVTLISIDNEQNEKGMGVPCANPKCSNRRAGFHPDQVVVLKTERLVGSLYQIPARERWRKNLKLFRMNASLLPQSDLRFGLGTNVLFGLQCSADVEEPR